MGLGLVIIFLVSLIAFAISAICGGGAGLMIMPVLGRLIPVGDIPGALSIGTLTSSVSRIGMFRKSIHWEIARYFVPAALPAVLQGAWALKYINPVFLEILMGLFLVGNFPFIFNKAAKNETEKKPGTVGCR